MSPKSEILFEWHKPQEIIEYEANKLCLRYRKIFPLTVIIALFLEVCLLIPIILILQKCGPEEAKQIPSFVGIFFLAGIVTIGILLLIYTLEPMFLKRKKIGFQITDNAFIIKADQTRKLPWQKISCSWVTSHEKYPNYQILNLFYKKTKLSYPLPNSDNSEKIISFVSKKVNPIIDKKLTKDIKITSAHNLSLLLLVGSYSIIFFAFLSCIRNVSFREDLRPFIFLIVTYGTLFIGPGTIGMFFLYRPLFFQRKDLQKHALLYNFIAFLILLIVPFALHLLNIYLNVLNLLPE